MKEQIGWKKIINLSLFLSHVMFYNLFETDKNGFTGQAFLKLSKQSLSFGLYAKWKFEWLICINCGILLFFPAIKNSF